MRIATRTVMSPSLFTTAGNLRSHAYCNLLLLHSLTRLQSGNLRSHAYCNTIVDVIGKVVALATCVHMRIATIIKKLHFLQFWLATCVHMRIATKDGKRYVYMSGLATCVHMRIATQGIPAHFTTHSGNLRSHAYCNGKNAQYYNTQSL